MDSIILLEYRGDEYGSRGRDRFSISYDELQELMQHQQGVTSNLKVAGERLATNSDTDNDVASQAIAAAQSHEKHLNSLIERVWKLVPPLKHTSDRTAAKAQEVFSIPELLEQILSRLTSYDKLQAMQVQRTWRDTVLGSVMLKRELGLLPFEDGKYYSAFSDRFQLANRWLHSSLPGGSYDDSDPECFRWDEDSEYSFWTMNHQVCEDPNQLRIRITLKTGVKLGRRVMQMRLCNPPITTLTASPGCTPLSGCVHTRAVWGRHPVYAMKSAGGCFTVGELFHFAEKVLAEHEDCPLHSCSVEFEANLQLNEDDMIMIQRRRKEQKANVHRVDRRAERQKRRAQEEEARQKVNAWRYDASGRRVAVRDEDVRRETEEGSEEEDLDFERSVYAGQAMYGYPNDGPTLK